MTTTVEFYRHVLTEGDILGIDEFFIVAVLSLIVGLFSTMLGVVVLRARPDDERNRILATILLLEGVGLIGWQWNWAMPHKEWMVSLVVFGNIIRLTSFIALSFCFLALLGHHSHRITSLFRPANIRRGLWIGGCILAILIGVFASDALFQADWSGACGSAEHDAWMVEKHGEDWEAGGVLCDSTEGWDHFHYQYHPERTGLVLILYGGFSLFATFALFLTFRSMGDGIEKRQVRAYGLAFGIKTGFIVLGVLFALALLANYNRVEEDNRAFFHAIALTFAMFVLGLLLESIMLAYGILREQIFGIDRVFRRGVNSAALAVFAMVLITIVVEILQNRVADGYGVLGGIGVAILMALGKSPLMMSINHMTNILMPVVEGQEASEVGFYRSQYEMMALDGEISIRDRRILSSLAEQLGLSAERVMEIEQGHLGEEAE